MITLGQLTRESTPGDIAQAILAEAKARGYDHDEAIAVLADAIQESGLRPKAISPNSAWHGIYQQDASYPGRDDPNANIREFFNRLDQKRRLPGASPDIWKNIFWLQQRPGELTAERAYANGRKAYLTEIRSRIGEATDYYDRLTGGSVAVPAPSNRPDFNEYEMFSDNSQPRGGTRIDLFLLHTQEGQGNADSLARWMQSQQVSYHYTVSMDPNDKGVTVVDVVDTDLASWSVLSANNRSINLCFAGSFSAWTRQQWLDKAGRAIDVAAYLAAQDTKKYGIAQRVIVPPYRVAPPGVSDHRYVTQFLRDGTHTDVGDGFPWDIFEKAFTGYAGVAQPPVVVKPPQGLSDRKLLEDIWEQLRGAGGEGWKQLGQNAEGQNLTLVDAVAKLLNEPK